MLFSLMFALALSPLAPSFQPTHTREPHLRPHVPSAPVVRHVDEAGCEVRELKGPRNGGTVKICGWRTAAGIDGPKSSQSGSTRERR